jgi:hypothetical protein
VGASTENSEPDTPIQLSLELKPEEAQRVIFAREKGSLWISLLPPGQVGTGSVPTGVLDLLIQVRA